MGISSQRGYRHAPEVESSIGMTAGHPFTKTGNLKESLHRQVKPCHCDARQNQLHRNAH
jgi:hypothetical protein